MDAGVICGVGIDIVGIDRISGALKRQGLQFAHRFLSDSEKQLMPVSEGMRQSEWLAGRFAVKEAAAKALGTGFGKVSPRDIIVCADGGRPELEFCGQALVMCERLGANRAHVSISHDMGLCVAVVILQG